jgi:hypothetical protein
LACHNLRLAIQRQMIGIARHQHMGDHRLGWNAAFDQPRRRRHLHDPVRARPADEFRAVRHDHPELRGDHIEPLGGVFADHCHRNAAAGACNIFRHQRHVDARQMGRQCAAIGPALGGIGFLLLGIALFCFGIVAGDGLLEVFQAELQLRLRQALRLGTELHALEFQQQMANPVVLLGQGITFADQRITFGNQCDHQRT